MYSSLSDYLIALLSSQWSKLELKASARIPNSLRSRVDISQIVNDSLYEWTQVFLKPDLEGSNAETVEDSLFALLIHILRKRAGDAVRKELSWKRGGRTSFEEANQILHHEDPRSTIGIADLEVEDTLGQFGLYLDTIQQSVLSLRFDGHEELEIATKLRIPVETVRRARKAIARIADQVLADREPRTKNQEPRTKNQEPRPKNQEPRKNSFEKWRFSGYRTRGLRLVN